MIKRRVISAVMAAALSVSMLGAVSAQVGADWVKTSSGISYKDDSTGKKLTGWQKIDGKKYYFDSKGYAVTGMKKIGGKTYYFDKNGVMKTGKVKINGKSYEFGTDGVLKNSSSSSDISDSYFTKPFKGLKWGMTADQIIKIKKPKESLKLDSMLLIDDDTYVFDKNGKLYEYSHDITSKEVETYKKHFKNEGWELYNQFELEKNKGTTVLYTKDDLLAVFIYNKRGGSVTVCTGKQKDDMLKAYAPAKEKESESLSAAMKGLKWGMTKENVIKKGGFKDYEKDTYTLKVHDYDIDRIYYFGGDNNLIGYSYCTENKKEIKDFVENFKTQLKNEGWKYVGKDSARNDPKGYSLGYVKGQNAASINVETSFAEVIFYCEEMSKMMLE